MPRFDTEDGLWNSFETDVVARLVRKTLGDFLVITHPARSDNYYVQFAV